MIGVFARLTAVLLLTFLLVGGAVAIFRENWMVVAVHGAFFLGTLFALQVDMISRHLRDISAELKRPSRHG